MRIYANLLGNWTDITDKGTIADNQNPVKYITENLEYVGNSKKARAFEYDYIHVQYEGKNYRINPAMIQIVTE